MERKRQAKRFTSKHTFLERNQSSGKAKLAKMSNFGWLHTVGTHFDVTIVLSEFEMRRKGRHQKSKKGKRKRDRQFLKKKWWCERLFDGDGGRSVEKSCTLMVLVARR